MFLTFSHPTDETVRLTVRVNMDYEISSCSLVRVVGEDTEEKTEIPSGPQSTLPFKRIEELGFDPIEIGMQIEEAIDRRKERIEADYL